MSFLDDLWSGYKKVSGMDALSGLFEPRNEGEYAGVDRNNFNLPGFQGMSDRDAAIGNAAANRVAPQARDSAYWQAQQRNVGDQLQRTMAGQDSLSALQLGQAAAANRAAQQSMASNASGGNAAMANLMAMQNTGRINQGLAGQQAMAGIAERNAAAQQLAGLSTGARGQDIGLNQFNTQAQMQQTALNDALQNNAYNRQLQGGMAQQQGGVQYEANRANRAGMRMQQPTQGEEILGAGMGAAQLLAMAKGGVVTKPTVALIGEAGPEAVIPLSKLPGIMGQFRNDEMLDGPVTSLSPVMARTKQTARGSSGAPTPPPPPPPVVVVDPRMQAPLASHSLYMHYLKGGR